MTDGTKAILFKLVAAVAFAPLLMVALSGCASAPSTNAKWYNPATWFAGSEAKAALKIDAKIDTQARRALVAAQGSAYETRAALNAAPASRPVEVATDANDATVAALDSVVGPLTYGELEAIKKQVAGLLSENTQLRGMAERERQSRRDELSEATSTIAQLGAERDAAITAERAQAAVNLGVANKYRNLQFWIYGAIGLWVFVAFVLPILGRAFPVVGAVASVGQSVVAPFAVAAASSAKRLAGDLVGGIHDVRERLKKAPATKAEVDALLAEWVTESDGTAAKVDAIRREKGLV